MLTIDSIPSTLSIELYSNTDKSIVCEIKPASEKMTFFVRVRGVVIYEAAFLKTAIDIYNKIESKQRIEDFLDSPHSHHRENWKLFFDNNVHFFS
jgi:hypothetical protein